ncbi:MAG: Permuted papain-like amidase enzyme YaeF/YiiX, family [Pseudomonadota bacterium]|jgi:hypothetical protein
MNCRPTGAFGKLLIAKPAALIAAIGALLSACENPSTHESRFTSSLGSEALRPKRPSEVIQRVREFILQNSNLTSPDKVVMRDEMNKKIHELDSLAVPENLEQAAAIISKLRKLYLLSVDTAQQHHEAELKGLWLNWSERLMMTLSGLQHYFSEARLNSVERKLDNQMSKEALEEIPQLAAIIHPQHEARLVSIYRSQSGNPETAPVLLKLLADSGGPLARLFIYQRFTASPSVEFANAMAQAGLPRTNDLSGDDATFQRGPFHAPSQRENLQLPQGVGELQKLPEQWKELKAYLESLGSIPQRLRRARDFWLAIHIDIEKKINSLPLPSDEITRLKKAVLQSFRSKQTPANFSYRRNGIEFREGDIILIQAGATGGLWETFINSGSLLSHMQMVTFDDNGLPYAIEMNYGRLMLSPLDLRTERFVVVRLRHQTEALRERMRRSFSNMLAQDISYDFDFDPDNQERLYCSELAAAVLQNSEAGVMPFGFSAASAQAAQLLRKSGIPSTLFYGQGSYLGSSHFSVVGYKVYADPHELIRGQMILAAFTEHISKSAEVKLRKHPESHTLWGLSVLAQTLKPELRRGLGPQPFVFTVMVLDRLLNSIDADIRAAQSSSNTSGNRADSRIVTLKQSISEALTESLPDHLSVIFPQSADPSEHQMQGNFFPL